jgi:predicted nuclease of restriction endonuclease-like RecB superfamily
MLPSDLLILKFCYGGIVPHRLALDEDTRALALELIAVFQAAVGRRREELDGVLAAFEGEDTAFKVKRGLAYLLANGFCAFETVSPLEPPELRRRVFELGADCVPSRALRSERLRGAAETLALEHKRLFSPQEISDGLYADLPQRQVLTAFEAPAPDALIHRYNLAQAQGVFYRAHEMTITAHRNEPARYKQLFRYVKLFQLMTLIEGDAEHGFTLRVDGPASLFAPSARYGLAMAKLLPALLHVTRWSLRASLKARRREGDATDSKTREEPSPETFELDAGCGLVSHYQPGKEFDSILEEAFAARWAKLDTPWRLEREVDLVPVPGSAIIPDFRLAHPDGRSVLLEIVGFWRPEYLRKKFALLKKSGRGDILLAVSERLNLEGAGVKVEEFRERIVWFKGRLDPQDVLERVEAVAGPPPSELHNAG